MTLGLLVTGVTYRHPGLLAKIVTTLDVLSGGRAFLGLGAAWYEREHLGLGVPFPPLAERFERLEETLQICLQMWSDDDGPYEGKHYQLAETLCVPQPIRQPHPPILIGGGGERKTLRLVAKYADACNLFADVAGARSRTSSTCSRATATTSGRDRSEIRNTTLGRVDPDTDVDAFVAEMAQYAALGFEHVQLGLLGTEPAQLVERVVSKIVPRLAEL